MFDLISFIQTIGYVGLFAIVFLESGVIFGFFFPGDSLLFTAGFLASQGIMNIWILITGVTASAILGVSAGYIFGRKIGPRIFSREDSFFFHKDNLVHTQHFYEKYGKKALILARFMPGVRTLAPIFAGVGKMNYPIFVAYNIIGGLIWGAGLPLLGYYLGNSIPNIDKYLVPIILLIVFVSILPTAVHILKEKKHRQKIIFFAKKPFYRLNKKILAFNWKMNPTTLKEAIIIAKDSDYKNTIIIPPFIFLEEVGKTLKNAELGAQDLFHKNIAKGSFTGEVSALELNKLGVKYVIIGHSERRAMDESDEIIAQKLKTALENNLFPILCVGETKRMIGGGNNAKEFVKNQLKKNLALVVGGQLSAISKIIIAYEPVWAIGTGENCSPQIASEMIGFIKELLVSSYGFPPKTDQPSAENIKVLYGGSVTSENVKEFLKKKNIDGVLIGGASLNPKSFFK